MVLAHPVVSLLNPGIDPRSVDVAAAVLVIMILGLIPFGIDLLCYRMFFALEDGRPTVIMQALLTSMSGIAAIITLAIAPIWAIAVMAFGQTIGNVVSSGVGLSILRRRIGGLGLVSVVDTVARIGVAAAVAGVLAWGTSSVVAPFTTDAINAKTPIFERMFASAVEIGGAELTIYDNLALVAHLLHVREVRDLADLVRRKAGR